MQRSSQPYRNITIPQQLNRSQVTVMYDFSTHSEHRIPQVLPEQFFLSCLLPITNIRRFRLYHRYWYRNLKYRDPNQYIRNANKLFFFFSTDKKISLDIDLDSDSYFVSNMGIQE